METLKEFRPKNSNVKSTPKKANRPKIKKGGSELLSITNISLVACILVLGIGQYKKMSKVAALQQVNVSLSEEVEKLKLEKMKYMADRKIQEIAKETLGHKAAHVDSLKAVIAKSKLDLSNVKNELEALKKVKVTELEYKTRLAAIEKSYQERLDAHNRESTDTINRIGRKMMADVDKVKGVASIKSNKHSVNFNAYKKVSSPKVKYAPASKKSHGDLDIGEWRDSDIEF